VRFSAGAQPVESDVIEATLGADWSGIGVTDPTKLVLQRRTSLAGLQDLSVVDFFRWPVSDDRDLNLKSSAELVEGLRGANRHSIQVPDLPARRRFGSDSRLKPVALSRPAISASGTEAVVAVSFPLASGQMVGCESGFIAYLEQVGGIWRLKGFGALWIT
jgi:hypothetical protein